MRTAKALLRAIDIRLGKERLLSDQKQKNYILKIEKLSSERRDLANSLESLCEVVLKRELGIERYMVLRVIRYQKFDTLLVKSRFSRPGLLMNSRTYLNFQAQSIKCL